MQPSIKSVDTALAAIAIFEASIGYKVFARFNIEQARRIKRLLRKETSDQTGKPLAVATIRVRLMAVKSFFQWLAD